MIRFLKIFKWSKDLNGHFSKEDTEMTSKHIKRCSTSLVIRELQIKTTVIYHFTHTRIAIIKKQSQLFTIDYDVSCGFVTYGLYYVEVCCLYAHFLESFCHKWMLSFIKSFFCMYWDDYMVFILQFVNVMYHTDWFKDIEKSLHPWGEPHLIVVYNSFNVFLDSVC